MNLQFETTFTVMPKDTNYLSGMIFGGFFMSELDLCAAQACSRLLHDSPTCSRAVTHKAEFVFHKPCYVGDLVFLKAKIISLGQKSIVVIVEAERERRGSPERDVVALAKFVFISINSQKDGDTSPYKQLQYQAHGLKLDIMEDSGE